MYLTAREVRVHNTREQCSRWHAGGDKEVFWVKFTRFRWRVASGMFVFAPLTLWVVPKCGMPWDTGVPSQ